MVKVWLDFVNMKDANFLGLIGKRLKGKKHQVLSTSRRGTELQGLLRMRGVEARILGPRYDEANSSDPASYGKRILALLPVVEKFKPDVLVSHMSPEAGRVAFGLRIPHIALSDAPHKAKLAKLTLPLAQLLATPNVIPPESWTPYGVEEQAIRSYRGLDAVAWVKDLHSQRRSHPQVSGGERSPFVVVRHRAASLSAKETTPERGHPLELLQRLLSQVPSARSLVISPPTVARLPLRRSLGRRCEVTRKTVDAPAAITKADLYIGDGGAMTMEAALLGVPAIITDRTNLSHVARFLVDSKLAYAPTPTDALPLALDILRRPADYGSQHWAAAANIMKEMEDPVEFVAGLVEREAA